MTDEVAKVTVIVETSRQRRTFVYPKAYNVRFEERMPEPRIQSTRFGESPYLAREQNYMETHFEMVNGKDAEGSFRTMELEQLDPVPSEIETLVTKFTEHNVNPRQRAKLIAELNKLVETDRKHHTKENAK